MNFTPEQIDHLMGALPGCSNERRRKLVRSILAEWGRIDVEGYLRQPLPQQLRAERKALKSSPHTRINSLKRCRASSQARALLSPTICAKGRSAPKLPSLRGTAAFAITIAASAKRLQGSKDWRRP